MRATPAACNLDPEFEMAGAATPFLRQVVSNHYAPLSMARRGKRTTLKMIQLLGDLPRDLEQLLRTARRGRLKVDVNVRRRLPAGLAAA